MKKKNWNITEKQIMEELYPEKQIEIESGNLSGQFENYKEKTKIKAFFEKPKPKPYVK